VMTIFFDVSEETGEVTYTGPTPSDGGVVRLLSKKEMPSSFDDIPVEEDFE
jgi:hypothetical protein